MNYIQYQFTTHSQEQKEILIAMLSPEGFDGFEETDTGLAAFIKEEDQKTADIVEICKQLNATFTTTVVENINWNKQWEENFSPIILDNFVAVRAGFHPPITTVKHEIIITPKMSFGTGHHATTHMMMLQMQSINFQNKKVLDFGTGTGVLAILAQQLGASQTKGIDNDEWSINNAKENIIQNNCHHISIQQMETIPANEQYDIILANINLNVILASLPAMIAACSSGGFILMSGFLKENEPIIKQAIQAEGLQYIATTQRGEWIAVLTGK
jgi:ribosomal protein L11 methyltransferase